MCNETEIKKMNSMTQINVPLQNGKKMKKRRELDALAAKAINKRTKNGVKRNSKGLNINDRLLSDSTDEQDYWTSSAASKYPRVHRSGYFIRRRTCSAFLRACSTTLIFTCVVATTSVMWLFIDLKEQVTSLRTELNQVAAGIQGVPDALQKCHTLSKDLQKNQTLTMNRLSSFAVLLNNFSMEMIQVKSGLQTVQDQLKLSPDLINNPRLIKDLSASVASFGSQIRDLNSTVLALKNENGGLDNLVNSLVTNVTETNKKLAELSHINKINNNVGKGNLTEETFLIEKAAIFVRINEIFRNLTDISNTLGNKLQWTADDQFKDHKSIEDLKEKNENIMARVKTLEVLCAKKCESKAVFNNISSSPDFLKAHDKPQSVGLNYSAFSPESTDASEKN